MIPEDLKYTESHEYVRLQDGVATVGITDHATEELGDVVFVELPKDGAVLKKGDTFGVVESVKAVSDLYMPVSGTILATNGALSDDPATLNRDPYGDGWMIRIQVSDPSEADGLLSASAYSQAIAH